MRSLPLIGFIWLITGALAAKADVFELHAAAEGSGATTRVYQMPLPRGGTESVLLDSPVLLKDADIRSAKLQHGPSGEVEILLEFTELGGRRFGEATQANVGKRLGIVINGQLRSAPTVREPIHGGSATISGNFAEEEANDLIAKLNGGAPAAGSSELDQLQGTWEFVIYEEGGKERRLEKRKFVVLKNHLTYFTGNEFTAEGVISVDPSATPKTMDFALTTGQRDLKIYVLAGNYMIVCGNRDGKTRPKVFKTGVADGGEYLLVLKRETND